MKSFWSVIVLVSVSFLLLGCPAAYYKEYTFIGSLSNEKEGSSYKIEWKDEKYIYVSCYYQRRFVGDKGSSLITIVKFDPEQSIELPNIEIISSSLGKLTKQDSLYFTNNSSIKKEHEFYYTKPIEKLNRKLYQRLEQDTINIVLNKKQKLIFTRKEQ